MGFTCGLNTTTDTVVIDFYSFGDGLITVIGENGNGEVPQARFGS